MFEKSEELASLGAKIIAQFDSLKSLRNEQLRIVYLYSDREKTSNGKKVYADTTRINDKIKAVAQCDFIITFYKPSCGELSDETMETLMYHELMHVGFDEGKCSLIPHDIEDFRSIIQDHGMDWII